MLNLKVKHLILSCFLSIAQYFKNLDASESDFLARAFHKTSREDHLADVVNAETSNVKDAWSLFTPLH